MKRRGDKTVHEMSSALWRKHVQMFDEIVKTHKNHEGVFVDGGCGSEQFLHRYADDFRCCIGIDFRLDGYQRNSDKICYISGDLEYIPLKDNSVDVFLTNFVLEHIKKPERFFEEVGRVMKPSSVFVSWTPNGHSPAGTFLRLLPVSLTRVLKRLYMKKADFCPTYYRANCVSKLGRMLNRVGFFRTNLQMVDGVFYLSKSRVVRWLHTMYVRISNHGWLRYSKDIIFTVYEKPENYRSSSSMCGRRPSHFQ